MTASVTAFTGDIPRHYDTGLGPVIFADYATDMARRATANAPARVLETAAGTGIVTQALHATLPSATHLTATDLNPDMLRVAQEKLGGVHRVQFQPADATALPFPDAAFDTVVCQFGVMFYPDKDKGFREAHRVLAPGGRYLFSVWDSHRHNPYARTAHDIATRTFPDNPPGFFALPYGYHAIDPIKEGLIAAGFRDVVASVVQINHRLTDPAAFATGIVFGSPLYGQIVERDAGAAPRIRDRIATALSRDYSGASQVMPMQAIVFEAHRPA